MTGEPATGSPDNGDHWRMSREPSSAQPPITDPADPRWLPPKPKRDKSLLIVGIVIAVALVAGIGFTFFGKDGLLRSDDDGAVVIGTTEASQDFWPIFVRKAEERGVTIRTRSFSDYTQLNPATSQGQLDLNLFQHLQYLADYNTQTGSSLTPVGSTYITPLAIYSHRFDDVAAIPSGGTVAVPNDATNQARALLVLQSAGLISLRDGGSTRSTPADVLPASRVKVESIKPEQTVTSLASVDAAVINNNFAQDAGLDPASAIYQDDPNSEAAQPYINVIVAQSGHADDPRFAEIVAAYHDPEVTAAVVNQSRDTAVIVDLPRPELVGILDRIEEQLR